MPMRLLRATILVLMAPMLATQAPAQQVGEPLVVSDPLLQQLNDEVRSAEPPSLAELSNPDSDFYRERGTFTVDGVRVSLIENAARGVGIRGGYAAEATRINDLLLARYRAALDRRYDFRPLMLQQGYVVPPAITRISNVRQLSGPNYLYLTNGSYEIVRQARLTTLTPTWIDWLMLPIRDVRPPDNLSLDSPEERAIWRRAVADGWEAGVREARMTFTTALATLHRDYHGMILFAALARAGAVSVPQVDIRSRAWRVTDDGRRAFEGETTLEIVVDSRFRRR